MDRQSCDAPDMQSSIALLQERFRQLQRAKEMREARELLRLLSELERVKPGMHYDPNRLFFHSELIHSSSTLPQGSHNLQTNFQSKHTDLQVTETPFFANLGSTESVMERTNNFDDSDVDTSLHLWKFYNVTSLLILIFVNCSQSFTSSMGNTNSNVTSVYFDYHDSSSWWIERSSSGPLWNESSSYSIPSESSSLPTFLFMILGNKRATPLVPNIVSSLFIRSNRTALTFLAFPASICTKDKMTQVLLFFIFYFYKNKYYSVKSIYSRQGSFSLFTSCSIAERMQKKIQKLGIL